MCNNHPVIARQAALDLASKLSQNTPPCEVPMSLSFRSYRGFPVECAATNNFGICVKRPLSTQSRHTRPTAIRGGLCLSAHKCGVLQSHILSFELLVREYVSSLHSSPGRVRAAIASCYPGGHQCNRDTRCGGPCDAVGECWITRPQILLGNG